MTKSETLHILKNTTKPVLLKTVDGDNIVNGAKFVSVDTALDLVAKHDGILRVDDTHQLKLEITLRNSLAIAYTVYPDAAMARI